MARTKQRSELRDEVRELTDTQNDPNPSDDFINTKLDEAIAELYGKLVRARGDEFFEKSPRNITIDSVSEFVSRIAQGKPENTAIRGAESTLSAILGRMAMDLRREVTWDEMMKSS